MDIHEVRKIIFERDGNKCFKCPSTTRLTLDHVNPKSKFHYHGVDNIITLCWNCNTLKYTDTLSQSELNEIKEYLNNVNQKFTETEIIEMGRIIEEYFNSPKSNHQRIKKGKKKVKENWQDLCIPDKNGKINKWTMFRMRD